ncbi:transcriptional regulator [Vairimorpha apis BRL 01]|uniref:RuvB-like helicase n=1 Tax=Vairimorpha apis BRL 01 TaxID=1037528 RepID=T0MD56_9MICR|nr:transcriptional regulator [Vairimorpha apis BRL 01]
MQNLRKSIGLNIKDNIKIIEGEVVSLNNEKLTLKTLDMESIFDIGEQMLLQIQKERITVGDIIRIVKERGNIIKIGISSSRKTQDFLGDANVVNCPEGEMFKNLEENQKISMHDIDVINDKLYSVIRLYNGETGEISSDTREEVDEIVRKWIMEEKAKIQRGVLCIEEAHMLDDECLNLLVQSIEFGKSPLVILTTNSEDIKNYPKSTLVVSTKEIQKEDLKSIFFEKFKLEEIQLEESALEFIIDVSIKKNISYAINIIHLSKIFCNIKNSEIIKVEDIKRMMNIFYNFQDITELY